MLFHKTVFRAKTVNLFQDKTPAAALLLARAAAAQSTAVPLPLAEQPFSQRWGWFHDEAWAWALMNGLPEYAFRSNRVVSPGE